MVTILLVLPVTHCESMNTEFHILSHICIFSRNKTVKVSHETFVAYGT